LCDLCHLPQPDFLEGTSMAPLLENPQRKWKEAVFSWRRPMYHDLKIGYHQARGMRTHRYRLNVYEDEEGNAIFVELFDYDRDPFETINLALGPANAGLVSTLCQKLEAGWRDCVPQP
jgi:arylsulfatase A-like enzyme